MKMMISWLLMIALLFVAFSGCVEKQADEAAKKSISNDTTFLEDFNAVNSPYKEALFATGQARRNESISHYENLTAALSAFNEKYRDHRPEEISGDEQFAGDMKNVSAIVSDAREDVFSGNLTEAHMKLEAVRPIFQKMLIRNDLLPLSVALVDFHDSMEVVLDAANDRNETAVMQAYTAADEKLRVVEAIKNDSGIAAIRSNLDSVRSLAEEKKASELPSGAASLKLSYVKVYLTAG